MAAMPATSPYSRSLTPALTRCSRQRDAAAPPMDFQPTIVRSMVASPMVEAFLRANRVAWDRWTLEATDSEHHRDVAFFRRGELSLRAIELGEVGDVAGKTLLHLLCNMGSDTLSWARRGAHVTGIDISSAAIDRARALATEAGLEARFLC